MYKNKELDVFYFYLITGEVISGCAWKTGSFTEINKH